MTTAIKTITAPTLLSLVSLAEMRLHCKLDVDGGGTHPDDSALQIALGAAHRYAEHYTGAAIGQQTRELALDEFPAGPIQIKPAPVSSITSVKYLDTSAVEQTMDSADYTLDDYSNPPWLIAAYGTDWPSTLDAANAVKVRFVCGSNTIDPAVKSAILLLVGHYYANREGVAPGNQAEIPLGINSLLDTAKDWSR